MLKLIHAIVHKDDSTAVLNALAKAGFYSTKLSSTGGLLRKGNDTIITAVEDDKVDEAISVIESRSKQRTERVQIPTTDDFGLYSSFPAEVKLGGATIMVTNIERFEKV